MTWSISLGIILTKKNSSPNIDRSSVIFFEISENFCLPSRNILQSLWNWIVETLFENSKFLLLKIVFVLMNVYYIRYIIYHIYERNFLQAIFNSKTTNFQKPILPLNFWDSGECFSLGTENFLKFRIFSRILPRTKAIILKYDLFGV